MALKVTINYKPRSFQKQVHDSKARYITVVAHRRFGKTVLALNHIVRAALRHKGRYAIVCPLFDQARSIYWTSGLIEKYVLREMYAKIDGIRMIIYFKNGSTLEFAGSDNPRKYNKYRGAQFDGLVMDEFSDHDYTGWKTVFRYTIAAQKDDTFRGGWVMFTGTVKGENHLWREFQRTGANRASFLFKASETGLLSPEDIEEIRRECDGDESIMLQELECIPMHYSGLVYPEYGSHNIVEPFDVPVHWGWGFSLDHGLNNPTSFGVWRIDPEGNLFRVAEYYKAKTQLDKNVEGIQKLLVSLNAPKIENIEIIADPSIWNENMQGVKVVENRIVYTKYSLRDEYTDHGLVGLVKGQNDKKAGISRMKSFLMYNPERIHPITKQKGAPKLFVFRDKCPAFTKEIASYRWKEKRENLNDPDEPVKLDDHAMDETRYFVMSRPAYSEEKKDIAPTREDRLQELIKNGGVQKKEELNYFD